MTNSNNNSVRFVEDDSSTLIPYLIVGNYEFRMTHKVMNNPPAIAKFLKEVGAIK